MIQQKENRTLQLLTLINYFSTQNDDIFYESMKILNSNMELVVVSNTDGYQEN